MASNKELSSIAMVSSDDKLRKASVDLRWQKILQLSTTKGLNDKLLSELFNDSIRIGDIQKVSVLISKGVNVNKPGRNSWPSLHVAAKFGHHQIVRLLIENGAIVDSKLNEPRYCGFTPLHLAVLKNQLNCAKVLLENGASVSLASKYNWHPIHIAVFNNNIKMAALFLNHGADINLRFNNNFFRAFKNTISIELWQNHDLPLLHYSILQKFLKMTKLLLNHGADINLKSSKGKTTLMQAVEVNDYYMAKLLVVKGGANIKARDDFGQPVLHFTLINANTRRSMYKKTEFNLQSTKVKIIKLLVQNGADVNARFPANKKNSTILHYMIPCGFSYGVKFLLDYCDLDAENIHLKTLRSGRFNPLRNIDEDDEDFDHFSALDRLFDVIIYDVMRWAMARQMAGLPVNGEVISEGPIHDRISYEEHTKQIDSIRDSLTKQVNFMKEVKIPGSQVTFWHILTCDMDELIILMKNKYVNYLEILIWNKNNLFDFFQLLEKRLAAAMRRNVLFNKSLEFIASSFQHYLPYYCCEKIVNYFSNEDLQEMTYCYDGNEV